jgi:glutathione peroxidase
MNKFYEFSAKSISWKEINMKDYEWKVIIVVNTASKCWLTPQYEWLENLYKKYKDDWIDLLELLK